MASDPPFERLPAELVQEILELAVESRRHDIQDFLSKNKDGNSMALRKSVFAPVQISSQSRSFALNYPSIWHSFAETVIELARYGETASKKMLQYCVGFSGDQLANVNLTKACDTDRCVDRRDGAAATIARSAASLKQIRLTIDSWRLPHPCDCHPPQAERPGFDQYGVYKGSQPVFECWPTPDDAALDIICRSVALQRLSLKLKNVSQWNEAVETKRASPEMMLARPQELQISDRAGESYPQAPTAELVCLIAQLASNLRLIDYNATRGPRDGIYPDPLLHSLIRQSASSLRELWVDGHEEEFDPRHLFKYDFPHLAKMSLRLFHQRQSPLRRRSTQRYLLPALTELESPAWIIDHVAAPRLRAWTIRDIESDNEEAVLVDNLERHVDLEDLSLHCKSRNGAPEISKLLQQVLRTLCPMPAERCPCPSLRRLSIVYASCISESKWEAQEAFLNPQEVDDSRSRGPWGNSIPYIGSDLLQLDKQRFDCSVGTDARCRPLHTIRVFNCIVDPSAWEKLLETSNCVNKWYHASEDVRESQEHHEKEPSKWLLPPLEGDEV